MEEESRKKPTIIYFSTPSPPLGEGRRDPRIDGDRKRKAMEKEPSPLVAALRLRSMEDGVDLGAIRKSLEVGGGGGVEISSKNPRTLRLNGHFISSGRDGVSTLTWQSLVSFFESRGYPNGLHAYDPIHVTTATTASVSPMVFQGKGPVREETCSRLKKRGSMLVQEEQSRSNKKSMHDRQEMLPGVECEVLQEGQHKRAAAAACLVDRSILWIKRKLNLDEDVDCDDTLREGPVTKRTATMQSRHNSSASCSEAFRLFASRPSTSTRN